MAKVGPVAAGLLLMLALSGTSAWSQNSRTIKIVAPVPPGGSIDILSRLLGDQIGRTQPAAIVIENRPGGGSVIGTEAVARAAPDGNTVLMAATAFVITPLLRKVNYDPIASFEPICELANVPTVLAVNGEAPYRNLADVLDAARAKPGAVTLASVGPGSPYHLGFETLKRMAKVDMTYVPYSGSAPATNALLGGHVTMMLAGYPNVAQLVTSGQLRVIAVAGRTRMAALPDVPTVEESGFPGFEVDNWLALFAPPKTPTHTVAQLADWFTAAARAPEVQPQLAAQGMLPAAICGADFAALLRKQYDEYGRVAREANLKAD